MPNSILPEDPTERLAVRRRRLSPLAYLVAGLGFLAAVLVTVAIFDVLAPLIARRAEHDAGLANLLQLAAMGAAAVVVLALALIVVLVVRTIRRRRIRRLLTAGQSPPPDGR